MIIPYSWYSDGFSLYLNSQVHHMFYEVLAFSLCPHLLLWDLTVTHSVSGYPSLSVVTFSCFLSNTASLLTCRVFAYPDPTAGKTLPSGICMFSYSNIFRETLLCYLIERNTDHPKSFCIPLSYFIFLVAFFTLCHVGNIPLCLVISYFCCVSH